MKKQSVFTYQEIQNRFRYQILLKFKPILIIGISELLDEINPIEDFTSKSLSLSFSQPFLDIPRLSEEVAQSKNLTYKAPLRVRASLLNKESGEIKESD